MADAGFEINGDRYEIPPLDTLTLDEERILYLYADTIVRDFIPPHPKAPEEERIQYELMQARKLRNPDLKRALAFIAYRRKHPDETESDMLKTLGQVNAFSLDLAMLQEDDASPPDQNSQNGRSQPNEKSEPTSSTRSGTPTGKQSGKAAKTREPTGTTG